MPDTLCSLWISERLGAMQHLALASFLHHGHPFDLYVYEKVANVPRGVRFRDANEIVPASGIFTYRRGPGKGAYAAFSNLFRYKLLLERGGWWVDTDVVCLKPFDFTDDVVLASEHTRGPAQLVTNFVMKLPPGHDIARRCYEAAVARDPETLNWGDTGPKLLHLVVVKGGWGSLVSDANVFCPVPWWEWKCFLEDRPGACAPFIGPDSYAVHLWNEMWRRAGQDQVEAYGPASFMAELQRTVRP